ELHHPSSHIIAHFIVSRFLTDPAAALFDILPALGWADEPPSKPPGLKPRGLEGDRVGHQRGGAAAPGLDHRCRVVEFDRPGITPGSDVKANRGGGLSL